MKHSRTDMARGFVIQADKKGVKKATHELAALLLEQGLHSQVDQIVNDIAKEYLKTHGVVEAEVTTAYPLSAELKKQISEKVKTRTKASKVILHEQIDRSLLGGVIVTAPDMELDLSLKTKLSKLKA